LQPDPACNPPLLTTWSTYNFPHFLRRLLLLTAVLLTLHGNAQFEHKLFTSNTLVEAKIYYGFFYAQHLELEIFNSHLPAFEINLQQETFGKAKWERDYAYPEIGLSLWYSGLGKSSYLGDAWALYPFVNFPLYRHEHWAVCFRFGLGLGYITRPFDRIDNYKNTAIGSHLNAAINIQFQARYKLSNRFTLSGGVCLQHFSNGSLKLPNYGLNIPMINLGVAYRLVRQNPQIVDHFYPPTEPFEAILRHHMEFYIGFMLGYKNMSAVYGENYMVYHLFENTLFPVSKKSKFGFGFDLSYDASHVKVLEMRGSPASSALQIVRPGINAAYELVMSKVGIVVNLGYYLGGKESSNGPLYEKLAIQYNFSKDFFATAMLKVHFGRADYIGWGIGYHFNVDYGKRKKM
jgi:hypothetical protein